MPWFEACPVTFRGWLCYSFFFFCCVQFDVQPSYQPLQLFPKQAPSPKFKICWLIQFGSDAAGTTRKQTWKLKSKLLERFKISLGRLKIFSLSELDTTYKAQVSFMTIFGYWRLNLMFCFVAVAVVVLFFGENQALRNSDVALWLKVNIDSLSCVLKWPLAQL